MIKPMERSQLFGTGILLPLVVQNSAFLPYGLIWPLFAAINLFNVIYLRTKVATIVREDPQLENDAKVFLKWLLIFAVLPFVLLYIFQRLGGFDHAFYVFSNDYHNPFIIAGWAVFTLLNLSVLYAVLWGGGARMLIQFRKAFRSMPESEARIKLSVAFSCLVGAVSLFVMIATNTYGKLHG